MNPLAAPLPISSVYAPVPPQFQREQWAALLGTVLFSPAVGLQVLLRREGPPLLALSGPPRSLDLAAGALRACTPAMSGQARLVAAAQTPPPVGAWYELRRRLSGGPPPGSFASPPALAPDPHAAWNAVHFGAVDAQFIRLERVSAHGERASVQQRLRDAPVASAARAHLGAWAEELGGPQVLVRHFTLFAAPPQATLPAGLEFVRACAPAPGGRWAHLMPDGRAAALLPTLPFASLKEGRPHL